MPERLSICRYDIPALIDQHDYQIGCEVGVMHGAFSWHLLKRSSLEVLYSIDSFLGKWERYKAEAESLLSEFGHRSRLRVQTSTQAAAEFAAQRWTVDFVYIDGSHKYRDVTADITAWWQLLSRQGLLAGHDYHPEHGAGVVQAVNEFVEREGLPLQLTREPWATWMVFKP